MLRLILLPVLLLCAGSFVDFGQVANVHAEVIDGGWGDTSGDDPFDPVSGWDWDTDGQVSHWEEEWYWTVMYFAPINYVPNEADYNHWLMTGQWPTSWYTGGDDWE